MGLKLGKPLTSSKWFKLCGYLLKSGNKKLKISGNLKNSSTKEMNIEN
jgi:hypothetical protein